MKLKSLLLSLLVTCLSFLYLATVVTPALAAEFTVNSTADAVDADPGDGACSTSDSECTLRAAVQETNALPGHDTILVPSGVYTLTIEGPNEDAAASGDLDITSDLTLSGTDAVVAGGYTSDREVQDRVLHIVPTDVQVHLYGLGIHNGNQGYVGAEGGGIYNAGHLTADSTTISRNTGFPGGGIYNAGVLTLTNSTVVANDSFNRGGGILNTGTLTVTNSTLSDNWALDGDGDAHGGGISNQGDAWLINTTIYDNLVSGGYFTHGSGGGLENSGNAVLKNSILAGNWISYRPTEFKEDCASWEPIVLEGYNLIEITQTGNLCALEGELLTLIVGQDPLLGGLALNDGPTLTHAPLEGSPVIDVIDPANCTDASGVLLATDQRGLPRPQDGDGDTSAECDLGSVELQAPHAVLLAGFTATQEGEHIVLQWETEWEENNQGFNLYRGTSSAEPDVQLNEELIQSQAPNSNQGFAYEWRDADIQGNVTYYYWLETVDAQGDTARFGPVSATVEGPTAVTLGALAAPTPASSLTPILLGLLTLVGLLSIRKLRRSRAR